MHMKKFTLFLLVLLAFGFQMKAQQFVSTSPANRNVILEEFTGRNCQYCPDGHKIANQIAAANPGRFWAINVHAGGYAATTYPNFNTTDGTTIHNGFTISGYPCGVVNRTQAAAQDRGTWSSTTASQLNQPAECNVAGRVVVNPDTRIASITVEVYYTANGSYDQNFLTVAMLQDSILGSQSGGSTWNPEQMLNGQYVHMHVLRDIITESAWGEAISPTTQGTLITKTYEYPIPEIIGSPNGVTVDLNNIFFLAWVSERFQGTPTRPILNACELEMLQGSNEPIYPMISNVSLSNGITCSHNKTVGVNITNLGTETLTTMHFTAEFEGTTQEVNWEGELPQFNVEKIEFPIEAPFGTHNITITLTEANGETVNRQAVYAVDCMEWMDLEIEGETEDLKLIIVQDKWGLQTTWKFTASDGTIIAEGGPYSTLPGGGTSPHIENVTVPVNECVLFTLYDSGNNGICCAYGDGYYQIKDSHNNVIVDGDGAFGSEAKHLFSVKAPQLQLEISETEVSNVTMTSADFMAILTFEGYPDEVGFSYYKVDEPDSPIVVPGNLNEFHKIIRHVDDLEPETDYVVKAYANVAGDMYYGEETAFSTMETGISEFEKSLTVYPNPAKDMLNVNGVMTSVEVYNTVGQCLVTKQVNGTHTQIDLSGFNNGIYFLRVYNNGETAVRKFSVNR